MADLESVLQDVSYLMAMEKSKSGSKLAVTKKVVLPDPSVHCVVDKHLAKRKQRSFKCVYNQRLGERHSYIRVGHYVCRIIGKTGDVWLP